MSKVLEFVLQVLNQPILPIGKTVVTLWMILYIVALMVFLVAVTRTLKKNLLDPVLSKTALEPNTQMVVSMVCNYATVGIGSVIILNTAGIEMTALTVVAGAVGLGLSLGLQNVARNFIGGAMVLAEHSVRLGDRIKVGDVTGTVTKIALRATTLRTDDELHVVVPNSDLVNEKVTNWTREAAYVWQGIPVVVSIDNDPEEVKSILLEAARKDEKVLAEPEPEVWLVTMAEKTLTFIVRIPLSESGLAASQMVSRLNLEFFKSLKKNSIKMGTP